MQKPSMTRYLNMSELFIDFARIESELIKCRIRLKKIARFLLVTLSFSLIIFGIKTTLPLNWFLSRSIIGFQLEVIIFVFLLIGFSVIFLVNILVLGRKITELEKLAHQMALKIEQYAQTREQSQV